MKRKIVWAVAAMLVALLAVPAARAYQRFEGGADVANRSIHYCISTASAVDCKLITVQKKQ
jgi:hypothetical protein